MKVKLIVGAIFGALVISMSMFVGAVLGMSFAGGQAEREVWEAVHACESDDSQAFRECFVGKGANPAIDESVRKAGIE